MQEKSFESIEISKLCEEISGKSFNEFQPGDEFEVKGIKIESLNIETNEKELKPITKIRYQGLKEIFELKNENGGEILLRVSENHQMFDGEEKTFTEIGKTDTISLLNQNGDLIKCTVCPTGKSEPTFDIEVEDNHNYFVNDVLSKNCTGGEAANFYPSTRFRVTPKEQITKNGEIVGITMKLKNYKNKTGIPFRECLLDVYFKDGDGFHKGIDGEGQYLDMMIELGIVTQHGAWFYYKEGQPDTQKFQGKGGALDWFKAHPDEFEIAKEKVNAVMTGKSALDANTVEVDEEIEYRKEQMEEKAKREAALASLEESEKTPQ